MSPSGFGVITADDLNTAIAENPDLILIDVRTAAEVEEKGYIDAPNVLFIPLEEFIAQEDQWPADMDAPIVVYCGSGHRSTIAMSILWSYGYTDVHSLKGGYGDWAAAGYATVGAPEMSEAAEAAGAGDLNAGFATFLADMEAYNTIGLDDLNLALAEDPPPFLLDVREPGELEENGHIEGAVNIPLREVADNLQYLPSFDTPIVSYCGSGWRCTIALTILEGLGWEDVKGLKGGSLGGWIEAGYPVIEGAAEEPLELNAAEPDAALVAAAQETLQNVPEGFGVITADDLNIAIGENPDLILIDVRTPGEVETKGYIDAPNVTFIPLEEFIAEKDQWPADIDAAIVVYCGSGHRSTIAMSILWANGYSDVHSLKDGFSGWADAGYPIIEGTGEEASEAAPAEGAADLATAFATFLAGMEAYNTIGLDDLNLALLEDPPPFILDVREPSELEASGHIEGAVNIPLREVADNIQYLPSFDTPIVSYCGSGWRCTIALAALEAMGWEDVKGLKDGSFGGWVEDGYPIVEGPAEEPLELNAADPDPALVAAMQEMLQNVPEGFGVITADDLNLALIENPDLMLIDVRRDEELAENGVIESGNWLHIPLEEFMERMDEWPEDKTEPIVIYCGSGHRSTIAMAILWSYGYEDVHSLKGGFSGWAEAGYPVAEYAAP